MKIDSIINMDELRQAIDLGLVSRRNHRTLPLAILNYTQRVQFSGEWTPLTRACRGLIYNTDTGDVVARPFRKFFNYKQPGAPDLSLDDRVVVTDKLDGSLGVGYMTPDGYAIATRGSFDSDQAIHATNLVRRKYPAFKGCEGWTFLFEIIFPANRTNGPVLDYGDTDDLFLIAVVSNATGGSIPASASKSDWRGPFVHEFTEYRTLGQALAAGPRKNAEGLVVHHEKSDERIKIKQEDYVRLHKLIHGLNTKSIWEHFCAGGTLDSLIETLPDEFHGWTAIQAKSLMTKVEHLERVVQDSWDSIQSRLTMSDQPGRMYRKEFAALAMEYEPTIKSALFSKLDARDYASVLWKAVRPIYTQAAVFYSEDTA